MVGGPPFIQHPLLAEMVGADGTASDGQLAVKQAEKLVSHQARAR
jgi:methanogenic corrinoid protein MtbC1